jgi:hypothetical protein
MNSPVGANSAGTFSDCPVEMKVAYFSAASHAEPGRGRADGGGVLNTTVNGHIGLMAALAWPGPWAIALVAVRAMARPEIDRAAFNALRGNMTCVPLPVALIGNAAAAFSEVELDPIADSGLLPLERLARLTLLN